MAHYIYIMASRPVGALYTGRTSDLRRQIEAHRAGLNTHTAKYNIKTLVWFEAQDDFEHSLRRERALKRWRRGWKIALITEFNPNWKDMAHAIPG
ncbi:MULTISPECIES: GIY-YIG nuclease family protein [Roseinatronobacter]|uniref:GIY-YIG nuclease family protein n=1 Tax=Roseinatronobacter domitianus TaxID=2940293 RepID=A0ABT0M3W3_9RHOB|nr:MULTISPECIES: GIY-YIG nuclease family protein [Roseibaca]MCL1628999.1 GIY-YIG nuclease family protein [Roseibaca domitiana]